LKNHNPGVKIITLGEVFTDFYVGSLGVIPKRHESKETFDSGSFLLEFSVAMMDYDVVIAVGGVSGNLNPLLGSIKTTIDLFSDGEASRLSTKWFCVEGRKCVALMTGGTKRVYIIPENSPQIMEVFVRFILPEITETSFEKSGKSFLSEKIHGLKDSGKNIVSQTKREIYGLQDRIRKKENLTEEEKQTFALLAFTGEMRKNTKGIELPSKTFDLSAQLDIEADINDISENMKMTPTADRGTVSVEKDQPEIKPKLYDGYDDAELEMFSRELLDTKVVSTANNIDNIVNRNTVDTNDIVAAANKVGDDDKVGMVGITDNVIPIPVQKKRTVHPLKRVFATAASLVFLCCSVYLTNFYVIEPRMSSADNQNLANLYEKSYATDATENTVSDNENQVIPNVDTGTNDETEGNESEILSTELINQYPQGMQSKFAELYDINSDIVGWIEVPGTVIDYPVVQGNDNSFYLDHTFYKEENRYGAIFADVENEISENKTNQNILLYGHQMMDDSMFTELSKYRNLEFYKENPVFYFDTLYENKKWKIFSVFVSNVDPAHDGGEVFNWRVVEFGDEAKMQEYLEECRKRSVLDIPVDVENEDKLIALTLCASDFDNARLVVLARAVRDGESEDVDVQKAAVNANPLYPQIWYDLHG